MIPRERVLAAFEHREPDRTPLFERLIKPPADEIVLRRPCALGFVRSMEIHEEEGWRALMDRQARDTVDLAKTLNFDMIALRQNIPEDSPRPGKVGEYLWQIGDTFSQFLPESDIIRTVPAGPVQEETEEFRMQRTVEEIEADYEPPSFSDDRFYIFRKAKQLMAQEGLDLAIYVSNYALPVSTLSGFMFEWFHTRPELVHRFYDKYTQRAIDYGRKAIELGADVIGLGGDFADNRGPMISPAHYREFIVPQIRRQAEALHALGAFVTNTSDGNLWPVLDDFLAHVDGYGEIDPVSGMDLGDLKEHCGDRICFLGDLDIRFTLCLGTPEDARRNMVECIEKGWGNGGHVIMTSNVVHKGVKSENYLAALDAHREYFSY